MSCAACRSIRPRPRPPAITAGSIGEPALLRAAGKLERGSEHPLAGAIVKGAEERGTTLVDTRDFKSITGKGVTGTVDGRQVALGNRTLMGDLGIDVGALGERAESLRADGQTVMFVVIGGTLAPGSWGWPTPSKPLSRQQRERRYGNGTRAVSQSARYEAGGHAEPFRRAAGLRHRERYPPDRHARLGHWDEGGRGIHVAPRALYPPPAADHAGRDRADGGTEPEVASGDSAGDRSGALSPG